MSSAPPPLCRYERKFVFEQRDSHEVELWVKQNPALFREAYPPRWVNNLYLDSTEFLDYLANRDGVANRRKIRVRWYGAAFGPVTRPMLEFKIKTGLVGRKEAYPLPDLVADKEEGFRSFIAVLQAAELPLMVRRELAFVHPSLFNRYHRQYYVSADGVYRLTLDSSLEFYRVRACSNSLPERSPTPRLTVLELKFHDGAADAAEFITNSFPVRLTRMSKYVLGVEALYDW
jgi:hypothetical protein